MNARTVSTPHRTMQYYLEKEKAVFSQIPGMDQLLQADETTFYRLEAQYPDAAFAIRTANSLFIGDHEQNVIHQNAYSSILQGDSIPNVRFRFDREMDAYLQRHMWD